MWPGVSFTTLQIKSYSQVRGGTAEVLMFAGRFLKECLVGRYAEWCLTFYFTDRLQLGSFFRPVSNAAIVSVSLKILTRLTEKAFRLFDYGNGRGTWSLSSAGRQGWLMRTAVDVYRAQLRKNGHFSLFEKRVEIMIPDLVPALSEAVDIVDHLVRLELWSQLVE